MDDFHKELNELKQFIIDLKADRAATKEKEKREAWTKYVSLTIVIIAVIGAIAAQWAGKYGGRVQMSQAQASDQWAYYQAKSIKQNLYEVSRAMMVKTVPPGETAAKEEKEFEAKIAKYDKDKAEIKAKAEALEKTRDVSAVAGGKMGTAVSLFSVAIAMASICTVTKKKPLWFIAMAIALCAAVEMSLAWLG